MAYTREQLRQLYLVQNKDIGTIASELGCHYNTVRRWLKRYGLSKDRKNIELSKALKSRMTHRRNQLYWYSPLKSEGELNLNRRELCFALYLDACEDVESWDFRLIRIPYCDVAKKAMRMFYVDFSVQRQSGSDWWVELKDHTKLTPHMKRLYAQYAAGRAGIVFRGVLKSELAQGRQLLVDGFRSEFIRTARRYSAK